MESIVLKYIVDDFYLKDLTQEIFIKVWKNIHLFNIEKGAFYTWILTISKNICLDHLRSRLFKNERATDKLNLQLIDKYTYDLNTDIIGLNQMLYTLPWKYRVILELKYLNGFTNEEIAYGLHAPLNTVKTRARKGLALLKVLYNDKPFLIYRGPL